MNRRIVLSSLAMAMAVSGVALAEVTGTIKFEGTAPEPKVIDMAAVKECHAQHPDPVVDESLVVGENNALANVIISIKPDEGMELPGEIPSEPAELDQEGCQYIPHVLAMMAGQKLKVKNSDPFLHNVHSLSEKNPAFNFGQPNKDEGKDITNIKSAELFRVKCDVHPWMGAYIAVFDHVGSPGTELEFAL